MVYSHQRDSRRKADGLGHGHPYQQRPHQPRTVSDRYSRNVPKGHSRLLQRLFYDLIDLLDMLSGGNLRYYTSIYGMQRDLGKDDIGQNLPAVLHNGSRGLIARCLYSQHQHIFRSLSASRNALPILPRSPILQFMPYMLHLPSLPQCFRLLSLAVNPTALYPARPVASGLLLHKKTPLTFRRCQPFSPLPQNLLLRHLHIVRPFPAVDLPELFVVPPQQIYDLHLAGLTLLVHLIPTVKSGKLEAVLLEAVHA